jgi:DNA-binding NarL/FixJ family response regulator
MARTSCLAGIAADKVDMLSAALQRSGAVVPPVIAQLVVPELGKVAPAILICDVDSLATDPLEMIRQLRFVLPECLITIFTATVGGSWALSCHLAGANCILSSESTERQLTFGLRRVLLSGCFTDPRFADTSAA